MKDQNMDLLKTMLLTWTDEEIKQAWALIAEEGKLRTKQKTAKNKGALRAGDTVSFSGRKAGSVSGVIVRVKTKKAIVAVAGQNWDVPLSMLTKE